MERGHTRTGRSRNAARPPNQLRDRRTDDDGRLVGIAASFYAGFAITKADEAYTSLISNENLGTIYMARANRRVATMGYGAYRTIAYDGSSDDGKVSDRMIADAIASGRKNLADAMPLLPEKAAEMASMIAKFDAVTARIEVVSKLGLANRNDEAMALMRDVDLKILALDKSIAAMNDETLERVNERSRELSVIAGSNTIFLIAGSVLAAIAGMALALFFSAKSITGPLGRLGERMRELSSGRLDVVIEDQDRRDEVGAMAKALQVFKDAANENKRLETEASMARQAQADSRDRQSAIDNAKAEDLKTFVHAVEVGFGGLSAGDLTVRMAAEVAPEFEPIRARLNESVAQLEATIGSVVGAVVSMPATM